jgi:hypothetical protein
MSSEVMDLFKKLQETLNNDDRLKETLNLMIALHDVKNILDKIFPENPDLNDYAQRKHAI